MWNNEDIELADLWSSTMSPQDAAKRIWTTASVETSRFRDRMFDFKSGCRPTPSNLKNVNKWRHSFMYKPQKEKVQLPKIVGMCFGCLIGVQYLTICQVLFSLKYFYINLKTLQGKMRNNLNSHLPNPEIEQTYESYKVWPALYRTESLELNFRKCLDLETWNQKQNNLWY